MATKTILVDLDDTLTWLLPDWVNWLNNKYSLNVAWDKDIKKWDMGLVYPTLTKEQIYEPLTIDNFWDYIKPRAGAVESLTKLYELGYEIYICTATYYKNITPKFEKVVQRYFPFIDWQHMIVAQNKNMIQADIIIDDAPHNLIGGCQSLKILISTPVNLNEDSNEYIRADNWEEIFNMVAN